MIDNVNHFASYLTTFIFISLVSTLWYFLYIYKPYAKFPACRLEHRILYWVLKGRSLNHAILQTLVEHAKRYESEGVFAAWIGDPTLIVYGEDLVKKIIYEPSATDKPKCYRLFECSMGKAIFTSNGEVFKKQWKMAAPSFHLKVLKSYVSVMNKHSEDMVERLYGLQSQPTEDIVYIISSCVIGILFETNLGEKEKDIQEYLNIIDPLNEITNFMVKRQFCPWLYLDSALQLFPSGRKVKKLTNDLQKNTLKPRLEAIKESLISRQASLDASDGGLNEKRFKMIGESFVEQHLQDPTITMEEVTRQIGVVIVAGFDTVIHSVQFALLLLGEHQDVQDRVFEEVMSETEGHVTYDDLQRLTYLECVIKESLRLYPVPIFARNFGKDLQCGEYKLPKNSTVVVFPFMLHRNPEIYPDPEKFDPGRFLDENSKIRSWNFIPFAEGLRSCIGKNYAMIQMKIILAHLLRNFRIISLDKMEDKDLSWSIVLKCTKNLPLQFLPRKPKYHTCKI